MHSCQKRRTFAAQITTRSYETTYGTQQLVVASVRSKGGSRITYVIKKQAKVAAKSPQTKMQNKVNKQSQIPLMTA